MLEVAVDRTSTRSSCFAAGSSVVNPLSKQRPCRLDLLWSFGIIQDFFQFLFRQCAGVTLRSRRTILYDALDSRFEVPVCDWYCSEVWRHGNLGRVGKSANKYAKWWEVCINVSGIPKKTSIPRVSKTSDNPDILDNSLKLNTVTRVPVIYKSSLF